MLYLNYLKVTVGVSSKLVVWCYRNTVRLNVRLREGV